MKIVSEIKLGDALMRASLENLNDAQLKTLIEIAVEQVLIGYSESCESKVDFTNSLTAPQLRDIQHIVFQNTTTVVKEIYQYRSPLNTDADNIIKNLILKIASHVVYNFYVEYTSGISPISELAHTHVGKKFIKDLVENKSNFCWVLVDIDYLGAYNHALGIDPTDRMIKNLGNLLKTNIRTEEADGNNDAIFHGRGDKFWILANGVDLKNGLVFSKRLLKSILNTPIPLSISYDNVAEIKKLKNTINKAKANGVLEDCDDQACKIVDHILDQIDYDDVPIRRFADKNSNVFMINLPLSCSLSVVEFNPEVEKYNTISDEDIVDILRDSIYKVDALKKSGRRSSAIAYDHVNQLFYKLTDTGEMMHIPNLF